MVYCNCRLQEGGALILCEVLVKLGLDQTISGNVVIVIECSYMCYLLSVPYVLFCASVTFFL